MTYLHFLTLNTGAVERIAPPDETATHTAALDLARALRGGRAGIASQPGYEMAALTVGPALLCTIYRGEILLTTFGVAARPRRAADLWRMMHEASPGYSLATDPGNPPSPPWCAVRVEPSMLTDPAEPWRWLAAYEAEVATAWIERRHRDA